MVFPCRCFSFSFEEGYIEHETTTPTLSTSTETFYTASSELSRSLSNLVELRVFTLAELKKATKNFRRAWKIGQDGFGSVYRGVIKSLEYPFHDIQVTVKYADGALQEMNEWVTDVSVLGLLEHPNFVKLVGYCAEDNESGIQRLLVYEYMPNRSVDDHLSGSSQTPLSWTMRLKVAQDAARALAYLHEEMDFQNIFEDFKSSNVLLDDQWNAKLSDFGLARLGPQGGATRVAKMEMGNVGYMAPEYILIGNRTSKSDIWSYGVFLYELITGRRPYDRNRPENEQHLLEWVKPFLGSKGFQLIVDPRLECNYSLNSAKKLSGIANKCLSKNPQSRPKMSEVLEMVNNLNVVPSQATSLAPPIKSVIQVVAIKLKKAFICTSKLRHRNKSIFPFK